MTGEDRNAYQREYRKRNLEKVKQRELDNARRYREENPDRVKEIAIRSYYKHRDRRISEMREKYHADVDSSREYHRQYAKKRKAEVELAIAGRPRPDVCEACGEISKFIRFDHCHDSGEFRGWICHGCNAALGLLKDDPERILKLAVYMKSHIHLKPQPKTEETEEVSGPTSPEQPQ